MTGSRNHRDVGPLIVHLCRVRDSVPVRVIRDGINPKDILRFIHYAIAYATVILIGIAIGIRAKNVVFHPIGEAIAIGVHIQPVGKTVTIRIRRILRTGPSSGAIRNPVIVRIQVQRVDHPIPISIIGRAREGVHPLHIVGQTITVGISVIGVRPVGDFQGIVDPIPVRVSGERICSINKLISIFQAVIIRIIVIRICSHTPKLIPISSTDQRVRVVETQSITRTSVWIISECRPPADNIELPIQKFVPIGVDIQPVRSPVTVDIRIPGRRYRPHMGDIPHIFFSVINPIPIGIRISGVGLPQMRLENAIPVRILQGIRNAVIVVIRVRVGLENPQHHVFIVGDPVLVHIRRIKLLGPKPVCRKSNESSNKQGSTFPCQHAEQHTALTQSAHGKNLLFVEGRGNPAEKRRRDQAQTFLSNQKQKTPRHGKPPF